MILIFSINNNDEPKPYCKPTLILLLFTPLSVTAQYDNPNTTRSGPSPLWMGILLGIATFLVVIMFIILNLFCKTDIWNQAEDRPVTVQRASKGLDPSVVESFPAFKYSDVAAHRAHLGPLECAVCLSPFEPEEKLRLLPKCNHVFHVECLDPWLKGQSTCPLCRVDLVPETGELDWVDLSPIDDPRGVVNAGGDDANNDVEFVRGDVEEGHIVKYKRWKSTGHVVEFGGMEGESWTRFTLMLPEKEIKKFGELNMKLKRTRSSF